MLKQFLITFCFFTAIFFGACSDKDSKMPTGLVEKSDQVITHDDKSNTITVQHTRGRCEEENLVYDSITTTYHYFKQNGSLYLWKTGECGAGLFTGKASTVMGRWTTSNLNAVPIPAEVRPADCGEKTNGSIFDSFKLEGELGNIKSDSILINETLTVDISQNSVKLSYDADFCMAQIASSQYGALLGEIVDKSCEKVTLKQSGKTAVITSALEGQELNLIFTYDTKTCSIKQNLNEAMEPATCPDVVADDLMKSFVNCIVASGYLK